MTSRLDYRFLGALLALTVGFGYLVSIPVLNYLIQVCLMLGIIYLVQVRDLVFAVAVSVLLTAVLTALLTRTGTDHIPYLAGAFLIDTGMSGGLLGWGVRNRLPASRSLVLAAIPALAIAVLLLGNVFNLAAPFEKQLGLLGQVSVESAGETGAAAAEVVSETLALLRKVFPAIYLVSSLITLLVVYLAAQFAGARRGLSVPRLRNAAFWQVPFATVWVLAAGLALTILGGGFLRTAGLNLLLVTGSLFVLQGWSIVRHFFVTRQAPPALEYMSYLVMFLTMSISPAVLGFIGLFDCWFDFRKLNLSDQPIKQGVK